VTVLRAMANVVRRRPVAMHLAVIADHALRLEIVPPRVATVLRAMANVVRSRLVAMHLAVIVDHARLLASAAPRVVTVRRAIVIAAHSARATMHRVAPAATARPGHRLTIAAARVPLTPTEVHARHLAIVAHCAATARAATANGARSNPVKIPAAREATARRARRPATTPRPAASATTRTMAARVQLPSIVSVRQPIVRTLHARHHRNASAMIASRHANLQRNRRNPAMPTHRPHRPALRARTKTGSFACRK
jgi:hypothetical protein